MFCIYCGAKIGEAANFCIKCGKPVAKKTDGKNQTTAEPTPSTPNNTARENIQQMVLTSISRVANSRGYYCFNCGCYVDRQRAAYNGDVRCVECGTPMIKPNFTSHVGNSVARYGLIGGALHSVFETTNYVQNSPVNYVRSYYYSAYYHQTKYPFEMVATDKGKMGEYLVEVGFQLAKSVFRNLKPYIFFNLLIPEANGSFQEIDALVIIGAAIYVIEAKNRSGIFSMNAISDKFWSFQSYSGDSSRVYSPLMQNSEHVVALQSYLADKLDFNPTFFNYVTLSGSGCIDWNIQTDEIDSILLGNWKISNTRGIARTFNEDFKIFTEEMSTEDYSQGDRLLDEKYALKTIEALKPILEMPEEKKGQNKKIVWQMIRMVARRHITISILN